MNIDCKLSIENLYMQSQINSHQNQHQPQVSDIMEIPLSERVQYALKMTEYMSRWKQGKSINLTKWRQNMISKITKTNLLKLSTHHTSIYQSLSQLIVQMIYLIYTSAINKLNLQINTNIYVTQQFTLFGIFSLSPFNLSLTYQELKKIQKTLPLTFDQFKDIFQTNDFEHLSSKIKQLKQKYPKCVPKVIFQNQTEFLFFNFQYRTNIGQDYLKDIIIHSVNTILDQFCLKNNTSKSIDKQSQSSKFSSRKILTQTQLTTMQQTFITELQSVPAAWSDRPMKYLQNIEKQVELMRIHSFSAKYRTFSLEGMLLNHPSKLKQLSEMMLNEKSFYEDVVQKYSNKKSLFEYETGQYDLMNMDLLFANNSFNGNMNPVLVSIKQQHIDFNHVNNRGAFVVDDTVFKHLNFMRNGNVNCPEHMVMQQIEIIKRQILLKKTGELISCFESLLQVEQNSEFYGVYLEHDYFNGLCQKAEENKVRQVDILSQEINKRLYLAEMNHYEVLRQDKGEDARVTEIVKQTQHEPLFQIPVLKLELFCPIQIQDHKQKNETIPEDKSENEAKYPYIEVVWAVKYLKSLFLERQLSKCQINHNLLVYLPEVRLVCPHKIRHQACLELQEQIIRLKSHYWSNFTSQEEILTVKIDNRNNHSNLILGISFSQHRLNNFILPLVSSVGLLMAYYFNMQKVLQSMELRSKAVENINYNDKEQTRMRRDQLEILKQRLPHHLEMVRSIQFALRQKLDEYF